MTHALTPAGGVLSEFTVIQLEEDHAYLTSTAAAEEIDLDLRHKQAEGFDVKVTNVTEEIAVIGVTGPLAAKVLPGLADMTWLTARETEVADTPVRTLRVSYIGESGWELHVTAGKAVQLFNALEQIARPMGLGFYGAYAANSMRLEKGYRGWGADLAMTMARTYTGNLDLLALRTAYHGPTAAAQSVTGISGWQHTGMPGNVAFVPEPNQYRDIFDPGTQLYLDKINRTIATATTGKVAGMIVESVQGYGGIIEMPPGYMSGAAERIRASGGLYIVDEVQSGFGRTGEHFRGFEADNVVPEIVVMAKGLGNGFPISAVVAKKHVAAPMAEKFMFHTYGANPTSAAAARAVLAVMHDKGLQENAHSVGAALLERLNDLNTLARRLGDHDFLALPHA